MATAAWYPAALAAQFSGSPVDWTADTVKVALCTGLPSRRHRVFADVSETEGVGYRPGGVELAGRKVAEADGSVLLDADDVELSPVTLVARYAAVWKDTGDPASSPLLGYVDFGAEKSVQNGRFAIDWHAEGVLKART